MEEAPPFRLHYHVMHSIKVLQLDLDYNDNPTNTGNFVLMGLVIFAYEMC